MLNRIEQGGSLRLLLRAAAAWLASAALLLAASSLVLTTTGLGSSVLGWFSSAISFFSAAASGAVIRKKGKRSGLFQALLTALTLVVLLLTLGFLISDKSPDPSGILSVVSFTFAGVAAGSLLFPSGRSGKGVRAHSPIRIRR